MDIYLSLGGIPGKDCGGFCKFCNFRTLDYNKLENLTCRYCPPHQKGCDHCNDLRNVHIGFKHPQNVIMNMEKELDRMELVRGIDYKDLKFFIGSLGDITFYPHLNELIGELKQYDIPIHLGYTSGKGIKDENMIEDLMKLDVDEISFSVFSCNPDLRRKWMNDKSPEASLKAVEIFSQNINVNASSVVIPGITDLSELISTGSTLEDWGVNSFHLLRFGNFQNQGNILNNKPIIEGIIPHSLEEFQNIVLTLHDKFNFRVIGLPVFYPESNVPYVLSKNEYYPYLKMLPPVTSKATIITSKFAEKYLNKIFSSIDRYGLVNIISVDKEIGDLITSDDLYALNLDEIKNKVIIPGKALMRDDQAEKILNKDGQSRRIIRGPNALTPINEQNPIKKEIALYFELNAFNALINLINY